MAASVGEAEAATEAVYARILSRAADRSALATHCAGAFHAEVRDALRSLKQAQEALQALRELQSAARFLNLGGGACDPSGGLMDGCEGVVRLNVQVSKALERVGGGGMAASESKGQRGGGQGSSIGGNGSTKKRKLSVVETPEDDMLVKDAKDAKDECKPDKMDFTPTTSAASPFKPASSKSDAVVFDPSESPIELSVSDSDDSDPLPSTPLTSCLEAARRLERGTTANQLSRLPSLAQQMQVYVRDHHRDLVDSTKALAFAEAADIAIRVGMKLQFLPPVREALASLLVSVETLDQVVGRLPSPLDNDVVELSLYFLRMTTPQTNEKETS